LRYSAIERRLAQITGGPERSEIPRPPHKFKWPDGVDPAKPDPTLPNLPLNLNAILSNLKEIQAGTRAIGAKLVLSSFFWMVYEGMKLDSVANVGLYWTLNNQYWPATYAEMEQAARFQNAMFRKFAELQGIDFIDFAARFPRNPLFFGDAVHMTPAGRRMHGWVMLDLLTPLIQRWLEAREMPRAGWEEAGSWSLPKASLETPKCP
jgi:hypothetical protein